MKTVLIFTLLIFGLSGCQVPKVPEWAKVAGYDKTSNSQKSQYNNIKTLTSDTKLSCEFMYCTAHIEDISIKEKCKPSKDRFKTISKNINFFINTIT